MQRRKVGSIAAGSPAIAVMFASMRQATAQDSKVTYPSMAPLISSCGFPLDIQVMTMFHLNAK
ncbi:MAG TPA: hypothetical protein VMG82_08500 [Candidatus Sulfotelmatobacter sp.]|nr:hypothetical protein [Candidatus Sulfotelmatobacter sp.]